jgi:outer membrane protein assembly factor BamC
MKQALNKEDSVDYRSVNNQQVSPLAIPPDLTQATNDPRYHSSRSSVKGASGAQTYTQYAHDQQQVVAVTQAQQADTVLPQRTDLYMEREGMLRWLVVKLPPEKIFAQLADFWISHGFTIKANDPSAGLIETDWAENRAKIPDSWIRRLLGRVFDQAYDSGEREKFRMRVERVAGHTEIFISHQHRVEKNVGPADVSNLRWELGPEDPELNATMLARLMAYLGTRIDVANKPAATVAPQAAPEVVDPVLPIQVTDATLKLSEPFDRAWRRVGVALDAGEFAVDDHDRAAGDYFVRYVDTDTGLKREEPGFLSRLFHKQPTPQATQYRLHVASQGDATQVTVMNADGTLNRSQTAQRLLSVLADKMRTVQ